MALKHTITWAANGAKITGLNWNDTDHIVDAGGMTMVAGATTPAAPSPGNVVIFGRKIAGGELPAYVAASGVASALQPFIGRNKVGMWSAGGNASSGNLTNFGIVAPTTLGSPMARVVATTNLFASLRRIGYVSAATAGQRSGAYTSHLQFWRGNIPGAGGFRAVFRFGCSDAATVAGARTFVGLTSNANITSNEPSAYWNIIGVGTDSTDANLCVMHNDGSGSNATKIPLGDNFPDGTLSTDAYELALFAPPNGDFIGYELTRLNTGHMATGILTNDLPAPTALMMPMFTRSNGATAAAVGIDVISLYIETDN